MPDRKPGIFVYIRVSKFSILLTERLVMRFLFLCWVLMVYNGWAQDLLIEKVTLITPASGTPLQVASLYVKDGVIQSVGRKPRVPKGVKRIDGSGKFALPGLWDMHTHLAALNPIGVAPENYVGYGVLHVRDMGGHLDELLPLRDSINQGLRMGPTIILAGPTLNGEAPADFHRKVSTEAEARQAVRELKAVGIDFIKIHRATSREAFFAIADETSKQALPFAGHVPLVLSWIEAAQAGMHSIEHIQTIYENLQPDPKKVPLEFFRMNQRLNGTLGDSIFAVMNEHHTYFDPTLIGYQESFASVTPELAGRRKSAFEQMKKVTFKAYQAGVPIITGTDVLRQHGELLHAELLLLESIGIPRQDVLTAATLTSAQAAQHPELGVLKPGSPASFILLEENPLTDLNHLRNPEMVIIRGKVLVKEDLERLRKR